MAKLFAMEELDVPSDAVELEVSPEEGEVADVQVEVQEEAAGIDDSAEAIEDGMGAADQLEEVETVVADAVEQGLDPVAAEAIRLAIEAISARVGANPKAVYSLYATENFQSASSRKANTKFALEGIGEFLKDMWKKIKAALSRLWEKVKAFWDKHVSSLGRIKKALESMKAKVSESSGKLIDKAYIEEGPAALVAAFAGNGDVDFNTIQTTIKAHKNAIKVAAEVVAAADKAGKKAEQTIKSNVDLKLDEVTGKWSLGTTQNPLVGGAIINYEIKANEDNIEVTVERETAEREKKAGVALAEKAQLTTLITETLGLINDDVKAKADFDKAQAEFNKQMVTIEKEINATVTNRESSEAAKPKRTALKVIYKANAKVPGIVAEKVALDVKLAKAVLGYVGLCVKNYK